MDEIDIVVQGIELQLAECHHADSITGMVIGKHIVVVCRKCRKVIHWHHKKPTSRREELVDKGK